MRHALTIAGSDSSGGAGVQADLKTFAAHGVYGTSAITALTAQSTQGVIATWPVPAEVVTAQIEAIAGDAGIHAVKTGMLATAAVVEAVAAAIESLQLPHVVVDPVIAATGGERLLDDGGLEAMKSELIRRAQVVTPNAREAEALARVPVQTLADAREAAKRIHALGAAAVIVTGGHLHTPDAVDVLYDGREFHELGAPRVPIERAHGAGCAFAAAIAANLALGLPLLEAARHAKDYVTGALAGASRIGHGGAVPDHFWRGVPRASG